MANKHGRSAPAPPSEAVEAEALAAWYGGDETALLGLIYHYEHRLHRFFTGKVLTSDIADLVQQTWEPILDRKRDERIQNFRAFLFGVARNVLHAYRRQRSSGRTSIKQTQTVKFTQWTFVMRWPAFRWTCDSW